MTLGDDGGDPRAGRPGHGPSSTGGVEVAIRTSVPGEVARFALEARRVAALAAGFGLASDRVPGLELAVHECLVNAWEHGHGCDRTAAVTVEVERLADGTVSVRIGDQARGGPWRPEPVSVPIHGPGARGHGRRLVAAGVDEIAVRSGEAGTSVELRLRPHPP